MTTYAAFSANLGQNLGPANSRTGGLVKDGALVTTPVALVNTASADAATMATDAAAVVTNQAAMVALMGTLGISGTLAASVTLTAGQGNSLIAAGALVTSAAAAVATDAALVTGDVAGVLGAFTASDMVLHVNTSNVTTVSQLHRGLEHITQRARGNSTFKP